MLIQKVPVLAPLSFALTPNLPSSGTVSILQLFLGSKERRSASLHKGRHKLREVPRLSPFILLLTRAQRLHSCLFSTLLQSQTSQHQLTWTPCNFKFQHAQVGIHFQDCWPSSIMPFLSDVCTWCFQSSSWTVLSTFWHLQWWTWKILTQGWDSVLPPHVVVHMGFHETCLRQWDLTLPILMPIFLTPCFITWRQCC